MTNANSDINMNDTIHEIKKKKPNSNSIAVLQQIQQKVKEMKLQDSTVKHRTAIALVSEEYRKQNGTVRKIKNNTKCTKCKKCKYK
jgi:hypothetical protein